jgi:LPXTG-site transpeptidase (sortase) family protein
MMSRGANRAVRWMGNVLLIAGAIAVGIWASSWLSLTLWQAWQSREFDQRRDAPQTQTQTRTPVLPRMKEGSIVGRLAVPRLHVRAMVREGESDHTLSIALGHIPGTALPGQQGNVGIAGHRDSLFRGLKKVAANDEITFETASASYVYRVESTQIVKPEDVGVLKPGPVPELTLVTCYPFEYVGSAPDRFIVKARLVSQLAPQVAQDDAPTKAAKQPEAAKQPAPPVHHEIGFNVSEQHSRELVPGKVWFGLSSADPTSHTVNGWLWVMPDRRTIWLRDVDMRQPLYFYQDGEKRELVITNIARTSATGYLVANPARVALRGGVPRQPASD